MRSTEEHRCGASVVLGEGTAVLYRSLADLAMIVHFAFIAFIPIGPLLAWRWPRLIWLHVPAVVWGIAIITIGFSCPLTPLELYFRRLAGGRGYEGGFVDRYLEDVIYPGELTPLLRVLAATAVVGGYAALAARTTGAGRAVRGTRAECRNADPRSSTGCRPQPGRALER